MFENFTIAGKVSVQELKDILITKFQFSDDDAGMLSNYMINTESPDADKSIPQGKAIL